MDLKGKLRKGLHIFGSDNRDYGAIDRYDDQYAYVGERRIPVSAFERMDNDRLYLGADGQRYFGSATSERFGDPGEIRVPIHEERLDVEKRQGEMGSVDIHKTVETEQVNVPVELRHEEVTVDRVDVPDRPAAAGDMADAFEEGTIRVPVRGEEAFATKEAVVTGEVVVDRDVQTERQTISDTVRKERVDIDENWSRDRAAFEEHFGSRRAGMGTSADTRTFADAEPHYRRGYEAAYDERYAGRDFADVEPDLRRSHSGNESWEHLREEIREGFDRGRSGSTSEKAASMTMSDRTNTTATMSHTVAGVFENSSDAERALNELKDAGFAPEQVSVVAKDTRETQTMVERSDMAGAETSGATAGAFLGGITGGIAGWLVGIGALAIPGIGPIVAAGALATTLGGAAVGAVAGGLLGALVGAGIPEDDARSYETHVSEGRILITAQAATGQQAQEARDAFDRHGGSDVRAYDRSASANTTRR